MEWWSAITGVLLFAKSIALNLAIAKVVGFVFSLCRLHLFVKRRLAKQGILGPEASWMAGNSREIRQLAASSTAADMKEINHDISARLLPFHQKCSQAYGKRFLAWSVGWEPFVSISEPELIQEVLNSPNFEKTGIQKRFMMPMFGGGLVMASGSEWEHQRRLLNPAFYVEKIKGFFPKVTFCASGLVQDWKRLICSSRPNDAEVEVHSALTSLTAGVICKTAFDEDFSEFVCLERKLETCVMKQSPFCLIPGYRYLPTKENRELRQINSEIRDYFNKVIDSHMNGSEGGYGNDILGMLLTAASTSSRFFKRRKLSISREVLLDECKTLFFAGHETTADLVTWSMMLLGVNPEWQSKARLEVRQVLDGNEIFTYDMLSRLKTVNNILSETLRLYPPAPSIRRKAVKDVSLTKKKLIIPRGVCVEVPILRVHHDPELWGDDVLEFNPDRFSTTEAIPAGRYMPFGWGPRICIGRNFALAEAKVVLSTILHNFEWELSPNYRHAPKVALTIYPEHGMQILMKLAS